MGVPPWLWKPPYVVTMFIPHPWSTSQLLSWWPAVLLRFSPRNDWQLLQSYSEVQSLDDRSSDELTIDVSWVQSTDIFGDLPCICLIFWLVCWFSLSVCMFLHFTSLTDQRFYSYGLWVFVSTHIRRGRRGEIQADRIAQALQLSTLDIKIAIIIIIIIY